MKTYDIAAYVWPAFTGRDPRSYIFWEEGIGEWQTVKNASPKLNGYYWDRKPLWGYADEADPYVMQMQIEAAVDHGLTVFIYDWYWYDGRPFLENCLNEGFLKAKNRNKMKFYLMWANHSANYVWDIRNSHQRDTEVWNGSVTPEEFHRIGLRWLELYFSQPNYYRIGNKPVLAIYDLWKLSEGLGGLEHTKEELAWLDGKAREYGFGGVHFQFIKWGSKNWNLSGVDRGAKRSDAGVIEALGFSSLTHYQYVHFLDVTAEYDEILKAAQSEYDSINAKYHIPYFPHASVGWDNNPRYRAFNGRRMRNSSPKNFERALRLAKKYADEHNAPLITINSWNEWTESSYLEPDHTFGYGYLEAVKKIFQEEREND